MKVILYGDEITEAEESELLLMRQEQLEAGTNEIGEPKQVI